MDVKIASDWKEILSEEFEKPYFRELTDFVRQEYASRRIFPRGSNIFRAFDKCPFDKLKVVIIGQDPYHGEGIVYMLWGSYAQRKGAIADPQRNCILKAVHPSPLSAYRGFFGSKHFSRANEYLQSIGKAPILW